MKEVPRPDSTVDQIPDLLDAALAIAFGPDDGTPAPVVVKQGNDDLVSRIHLREPPAEAHTPIVRPSSPEMPRQGSLDTMAGRYQLQGEIARGGMGAILKGRDQNLGRDIAVKVLLEAHLSKNEMVDRFVEEAQIAGQLQHPGIVPIYELGQFPDRRPYFTMKLVKGRTLAALLVDRAAVPDDRTRFLKVFEQVCQTVAYAHARGVIHRDLKPSNIMVGAFGEVQVMDWGLAKVLGEGGIADEQKAARNHEAVSEIRTVRSQGTDTPGDLGSHTRAGSVLGTPAYMAPEQAQGKVDQLDARCDVFSLGAILCEILTGKPAYIGSNSTQVHHLAMRGDLSDALARLRACDADVELINLAKRCLAPAPGDRPRDAAQLAAELTAYLESVEVRLRQAELDRAAAQIKTAEERKRRRLTVGLAVAILALMLLATGAWTWRLHEQAARDALALRQETELEAQVGLALDEATRLRDQARQQPAKQRELLTMALAAARRADGMLTTASGADALRQRVAALIDDLNQEERDEIVLARLQEASLRIADMPAHRINKDYFYDDSAADPLFTAAFRDYGADVDRMPFDELVARLKSRPIRAQLAAALDDWVRARTDPSDQRLLRDLARAVDDDETRNKIREARWRHDRKALLEMAASHRTATLPAHSMVLLARDLNWNGDVAPALELLRKAVARYPDDFWVNHEMASVLKRLPSPPWDEIIRFESIAAALRHTSSGTYSNLGAAFAERGDLDQAIAAYEKALELNPDNFLALTWLGSALVFKGDTDRAIDCCRKAILLDAKDPVPRNILGDALRIQGKAKESADACREAIRLRPEFPEAHNNLGNALWLQGELEKAAAEYRLAIDLNDKEGGFEINLGLVLQIQGDLDEAIKHLRKGLELVQSAPSRDDDPTDIANAWFQLGLAYASKARWEESLHACRQALALSPKDPAIHYNIGRDLQELGKDDEALPEFKFAIALKEDFAEAYVNLGSLQARKNQWAEAANNFRKAVAYKDNYTVAYNDLAYVLRKQGKLGEAITAAKRAIELKPDYAEAHLTMGLALSQRGEFDAALTALKRGHELGVKTPGWSMPSAEWVAQCETFVALNEKLPRVVKGEAEPKNTRELVQLAQFAHGQKQLYGAAAQLWERLAKDNPRLRVDGQDQRYNAARAAALIGCGRGEDASAFDEKERARWRRQALEWLRADLEEWTRLTDSGPSATVPALQRELQHWQEDDDLVGLRGPSHVSDLPTDERETCRKLWADVRTLLARNKQ